MSLVGNVWLTYEAAAKLRRVKQAGACGRCGNVLFHSATCPTQKKP